MKDIQSRKDIEFLVNIFYSEIKKNKEIGFFFTEISQLNFDDHLPKMYNFWESIIFKKASYSGNPMLSHILLNKKSSIKIEEKHFNIWISLWRKTVKANFKGENAEEAIQRAEQIAQLIQYKIS